MRINTEDVIFKKRSINLTVQTDVLTQARALSFSASKMAECGVVNTAKEARSQEWLLNNKEAIFAHNERIEKHGMLLAPHWSR